jgi:hypothetical protein
MYKNGHMTKYESVFQYKRKWRNVSMNISNALWIGSSANNVVTQKKISSL